MLETHHINKLFSTLSVGDQAIFEFNLKRWKLEQRTHPDDDSFKTEVLPKGQHILLPSVMDILNDTANGKMLLKYYNDNNVLHEEQRTLLIATLANYIDDKGIFCKITDCSELEKQICVIFPTENIEFYSTGKRGRLYNKIANLKRQRNGILQKKNSNGEETTNCMTIDDDITLSMQLHPSINAEEFDLYWRKTSQLRFFQLRESKNFDEIVALWPEYAKQSGSKLIEIDFSISYPQAKEMKVTWPFHEVQIIKIMKKKISNSVALKLLANVDSSTDEDSRIFIMLWVLHHMFPPNSKIVEDKKGSKLRKKYSVADSQEAFAIIAGSHEEFEAKINLLKLQEKNFLPKLGIIGDFTNINDMFVFFFQSHQVSMYKNDTHN
ncbi:uncharacterized protein LOC142223367 [Haematobia irritans]|uniref:uncharacterized protein LOC142223367 n=1 Tax=Haematobia irritans TaxID=7368 RepID=UPI003F4FA49D